MKDFIRLLRAHTIQIIIGVFVLFSILYSVGVWDKEKGVGGSVRSAVEWVKPASKPTTPEREERVSVKDFAPGESFRKVVQSTGLDWEVMSGCLTVESVSSRNPRMLETVCEGAPKQLRPSAAYIDFRAEAGPATLRMVE